MNSETPNIKTIVVYKAQEKDWQLCRDGDSKSVFYTASKTPRYFDDPRDAKVWAEMCQSWARQHLGWTDAIFETRPVI